LIEGLGNSTSDVDVYVISPDPQRLAERSPSMALGLDGYLVDLELHGVEELEALVERFERWAASPRVVSDCFRIAERDRLTLHRIAVATHAWGDPAPLRRFQERVRIEWLARHKLDWSIAWISTLQVDLEGLRRATDWQTMLPISNDLLGYTADALLAAHLKTNPTPKWRFPLLRTLPSDWERDIPGCYTGRGALDVVLDLMRTPLRFGAKQVHERALAIVALSRRVLSWAGAKLFGVSGERLPGAARSAEVDGPPLGHMGLAVQMVCDGTRFVVVDSSRGGYRFEVSAAVAGLLCFFDGVSTAKDVEASLGPEAPARIEEALGLVHLGGFAAQPIVDVAEIEALLADRSSST
jgi:hypothetical protein